MSENTPLLDPTSSTPDPFNSFTECGAALSFSVSQPSLSSVISEPRICLLRAYVSCLSKSSCMCVDLNENVDS